VNKKARPVALFFVLLAGCNAGTRSPAGAARALAEASQAGDRAAVWRLLGPKTRARLEADAARAGVLAGRRPVPPEQMLAVGWFTPRWQPEEFHVRSRSGDQAVVEVVGPHGESETVDCTRVGGEWKVELP
jgi:hypothetical protein